MTVGSVSVSVTTDPGRVVVDVTNNAVGMNCVLVRTVPSRVAVELTRLVRTVVDADKRLPAVGCNKSDLHKRDQTKTSNHAHAITVTVAGAFEQIVEEAAGTEVDGAVVQLESLSSGY